MVEEASPVWCPNGLVTRNHNVMKSNEEKKKPHNQTVLIMTYRQTKISHLLKDLERNTLAGLTVTKLLHTSGTLSKFAPPI